MQLEFDPRKSDINKAKHGIGFVKAQTLWKSKIVLLGAKNVSEKRYLAIGTIEGLHCSAIITYRGWTIRIISVRKSTQAESTHMKKSEGEATTAKNLEGKFDRGENVLDYFDGRKARVIDPQSKGPAHAKFAYPMKRNSKPTAIVREKPAGYRKKK